MVSQKTIFVTRIVTRPRSDAFNLSSVDELATGAAIVGSRHDLRAPFS